MYSFKRFTNNIRGDLFGGVTAAIVALPLALAFGISSGAGAVSGLYGAVIVGFCAAIFGGTATQISGPTGPMTVVMTAMITHYLAVYPESGLVLAFTTVFLGGCLQVVFGILKLGKYIIMVPYPVISGFMTGIGVIIILLELGPVLGFPIEGSVVGAVLLIPKQLSNINYAALITASLTLIIVLFWRGKINRIFPAPLVALIVVTVIAQLLFANSDIQRIGQIPSSLPSFHFPVIRAELLESMFINALMLAVLGSIDSLLTSLVADNVTATQHNSDKELIGQGIGNATAGLFGGLPGAGATMRTMVNIRAGGSGPLSGATHAGVLLAVALGLGFLFESIPVAVLAGILIKVGIDIIDWPFLKRLHRLPKFPVALMTVVFLLTVFVDLITAVFVGVFVKNLVTISKLSDLELGNVIISDGTNDQEGLRKKERKALEQYAGGAVLFRITGPVSYAVGRGLSLRFEQFKNRKLLLVDIAQASIIGISTTMVIEELIRRAISQGTHIKLVGLHPGTHHELKTLGLETLVGSENCCDSFAEALAGFKP